ncbi:MAG: hypothetical protein RL242_3474 [Pseudomonadota bacterium]
MNTQTQLDRLDMLEVSIARGIVAMDERNDLIARLVASGEITKADLARRINAKRLAVGAPTISWDNVSKIAMRHGPQKSSVR